jgi:hypothetical protein
MTIGKTAAELHDLICHELAAAGSDCGEIVAESVRKTGAAPPYDWDVVAGASSGRDLAPDEQQKLVEIKVRLRREYHLLTDEQG